jgi:hypothetical protein
MKRKRAILESEEEEIFINLTLHNIPGSIIAEFSEKIVSTYYNGNLNAAIQDLITKELSEQEFVHSHITHIRRSQT